MPSRFEEILVFGIMSILVALFTWIYTRDREQKSALWLAGWVAIFVHFAVPLLDDWVPGWKPAFTVWINRATLIVAGTFFFFSVSAVYASRRRRALFTVLISGAAVLYLSGIVAGFHQSWFYAGLLSISAAASFWDTCRHYGWKNWFWVATWAALAPYAGWSISQASKGHPGFGLDLYLFSLFVLTGLLYFRRFRRLTPGVLFTSASFLAWGAVFPLGSYLYFSQHIMVSGVVWDVPKYFVAFGMILTLFENQTEAASSVARQYHALFEGNLAAVYVSTFEGRLLDCNSAFLHMYGFESRQEALAGARVSHCADPGEWDTFLEKLNRNGQVLNHECRHRRKDGAPFWVLERATTVIDSTGQKVIEGTAIDITERKQAEIALTQSEQRFANIFRQSPIGCVIVSQTGVVLNANEALLKLLARPAEEVVGKTSVELGFWKNERQRALFYERLRSEGSVHNLEIRFKDANSNRREGLYFATLVRIGEMECIFGMLMDQTEQRDLEAKFLQAQKMEALGRLAGGVAHDFNNLLGVIGGYAELLDIRLSDNDTLRRYCGTILDTTQRASGLTRQLLTFSRKEITRPTRLRPDAAIKELAAILPRMIGEDVELIADLRSTATVVMDKTHFEQIVFNIVVNARDAMPNGGQLLIETEDIYRPAVSPEGSISIAQFVGLRFCDSGTGMDEETRSHAFEPFYTTKGLGRGTGLGLATVYGIVQQCSGQISIDSQLGCGTRVTILLPAIPGAQPTPGDGAPCEVQTGAGNILLVEDEVELRNANAEFLSSIGYSVICAGSGTEALEMVREAGPIDLVISDVVMPKMNGREFADHLLQVRPDTKLLFVSGYADDVVLQTGVSINGRPFLQKPYSLKQLGNVVHELLAVNNGQQH